MELNWTNIGEEFVRFGLIFGAIFQLICIAAAIFLPCKSEFDVEPQATNQRSSAATKLDQRFQLRTNEQFLEESDDQQSNGGEEDLISSGKVRNRSHYHQRAHHHDDNHSNRSSSSGSTSAGRMAKKQDKKKRR